MIIGITTIRDEEDVIQTVLRHLILEGVDHLLVADNLSRDSTRSIVADEATRLPITLIDDTDPGHSHDVKMSRLAAQAYEMGATWVLPFDADEVWYAPSGTIDQALAEVPDEVTVLECPGWDHIVREEGDEPFSPWRRANHQTLAKVAFRAHPQPVIHFGNHGVQIPGSHMQDVLRFRHFQYRSLEQMTRKFRDGRKAVEAANAHMLHCSHWRSGALKTDDELAASWAELCSETGLVNDPAPFMVTA